ncbi:MAG: YjfB family protein [Gammaproteobacteria bacterium]
MDVSGIAQLATNLASQRISENVSVAVSKLANDNAKATGEAVVQLIEAVPQPEGSLGHNINVTV